MENFDFKKIAKNVKLQKKEGQKIVKKKAGRPRIKPKVRVEIRMDSVLKSKFDRYAKENGQKGVSELVVPLIKKFLIDEGYY